jgi:hypothetical protein
MFGVWQHARDLRAVTLSSPSVSCSRIFVQPGNRTKRKLIRADNGARSRAPTPEERDKTFEEIPTMELGARAPLAGARKAHKTTM